MESTLQLATSVCFLPLSITCLVTRPVICPLFAQLTEMLWLKTPRPPSAGKLTVNFPDHGLPIAGRLICQITGTLPYLLGELTHLNLTEAHVKR
jgi:hypothetical protein